MPAETERAVGLREPLKALGRAIALVFVIPSLASFTARALLLGRDRALQGSTQTLSLVPGLLGQYLRRAFLGRALARFAPSATAEFGVLFSRAGAEVDANVYLGPRCHLGLVHIERDALLGAGVHVTSGARTHGTDDVDRPIRDQPGALERVRIGAGAWIGSAAIIMADVGRGTIVGAGSVVTRPLPDRVVAAGAPARVIRSRESAGNDTPGAARSSGDTEGVPVSSPSVVSDVTVHAPEPAHGLASPPPREGGAPR